MIKHVESPFLHAEIQGVVHSISYSDVKKISKEEIDAIDAIEGKVRRRYLRAYVHSPECFECTKVRLGID